MEPVELLMLVEDAVEDLVELFEAATLPVREAGPRCLVIGGFSTGTGSEGSSTFSSSSLGLTAVLRLGLKKVEIFWLGFAGEADIVLVNPCFIFGLGPGFPLAGPEEVKTIGFSTTAGLE